MAPPRPRTSSDVVWGLLSMEFSQGAYLFALLVSLASGKRSGARARA
jgi:hypothetical protein